MSPQPTSVVVAILIAVGLANPVRADHSLAGAHAHNNLLGWVTTAIYGLYYAVVPAARTRLAVVHLAVTLAGNLVFPIGIALAIMGQSPALAAIGGTLQMLSMIIFAYTIWRHRAGLVA